MKRFIASLLTIAAISAEDTEKSDEDKGLLDSMKNWASSEQEPVIYESISKAEPYTFKGRYGRFTKLGTDLAFITQAVGGAALEDGAIILTWAQFEDPETPGNTEGFFCSVKYKRENEKG